MVTLEPHLDLKMPVNVLVQQQLCSVHHLTLSVPRAAETDRDK